MPLPDRTGPAPLPTLTSCDVLRLLARDADIATACTHAVRIHAATGGEPAAVRAAIDGMGGPAAFAPEIRPAVNLLLSDPTGALSHAELRVAGRAVLGESNDQIAAALGITRSTVEQHLTRCYRKLGAPGRAGLRARLVVLTCGG